MDVNFLDDARHYLKDSACQEFVVNHCRERMRMQAGSELPPNFDWVHLVDLVTEAILAWLDTQD